MTSRTMRAYAAIQPVKNVAGLAEYLKYGRGADRKTHLAHGTNRYAAMYCDGRSPEVFVVEAIRHARHNKRSNEAYSAIVAPPLGTYDGHKPQAMREMVSDVVEGQRRAHPNAKLLAVAHNDSKGQCGCGGKPHVHVVIMNHDLETGKAITANRTASSYRAIINELGAELGWQETEVTFKKDHAKVRETLVAEREIIQAQDKIETAFHEANPQETSPEIIATERAKLEAARKKLANAGQFDQQLVDDVLAARNAAVGETFSQWQQDFRKGLRERGIALTVTEKGKATPHLKQRSKTQGLVYSRPGEAKGKKRAPGRKASALSPEVTVKGLTAAFQHHLEAAKQAAIDAEAARIEKEAKERQDAIEAKAEADRIATEKAHAEAAQNKQREEEQRRQNNPSLFGLVIDDVSYEDVKAWMKGHQEAAQKAKARAQEPDISDIAAKAQLNIWRRHNTALKDADAVFNSVKDKTGNPEQARQALMQHVAEQKVIEERQKQAAQARTQRALGSQPTQPQHNPKQFGG